MAASFSITNPETNRTRESKRKKRRKIDNNQIQQFQTIDRSRWRTESEQQIYSSKLFEALRQVRRNSPPESSAAAQPVRGHDVHETADRVLAVAAKGSSRWSRAILTSRLRLRMNIINKKRKKAKKPNGRGGILTKPEAKKAMPSSLERKVKVLGRLVPGCRKVSFPSLLEETTDYIAALEMQVRAMTALTNILAGAGSFTPA